MEEVLMFWFRIQAIKEKENTFHFLFTPKKKKGGQDEFANMRSKVKNFYFDSLFNLKIEKIRAG